MSTSTRFRGDPSAATKRGKPRLPPKERRGTEMKTSRYDKVSGSLTATLLLLGVSTGLLFLIWLGQNIVIRPPVVPVTISPEGLGGGGSGNGQEGPQEHELEEPSPEELQITEPNITETLDAVTDVVSTQALELDNLDMASAGFGKGQGTGRGDGRGPGPGGPGGAKELPEWEVRFLGGTLEQYADQLDFFRIELAAVGGGKKGVDYVNTFKSAKPVSRAGNGKNETRRYLLWRKGGSLQEADKTFLTRAGVEHAGRIIFQLIPPEVELAMATMEAQKAHPRRLAEIKKTIFGVKGGPGAWEMFVAEQQFRF